MNSEPRVAFVVDTLPSIGGGEKVLFAALEAYPQADIFTLIYNKKVFSGTPIANRNIHTSWLDALPYAHTQHRYLLPLMPAAIERIRLRGYDLIVSFNYAVANGARNHNGARHVSYTHTPMRYAWMNLHLNGTHARTNRILDRYMHGFREWDRKAASRVHAIATNSLAVSRRIRLAYGRDASVIYPPVDVERFHPNLQREKYFITVSRLVPHKRLDLVVQAFNQLQLPLIIIGDGPELPRLKAMAESNIQWLGFESDETVADLSGRARAFVCAAEEDFGIAIVEAQAAGCPVIAYGAGGAVETVIDGVTGILYSEQSVSGILDAIERFERTKASFHTDQLVDNARRFSKDRFIREFVEFVQTNH